jgi:hypothetical protein
MLISKHQAASSVLFKIKGRFRVINRNKSRLKKQEKTYELKVIVNCEGQE